MPAQELKAEVLRLQKENISLKNELKDLRLVEEKFSKAFIYNQAMMTISRLKDNNLISINREFTKVLGYEPGELEGQCVLNLNHWGNFEERQKLLQDLIEHGCAQNHEVTFNKKSGEIGFAIMSAVIIDIGGEEYILCSAIDITERKKAEEELMASEDKFSKSFHESGAMKVIARCKDGVLIDVNESYASTFGFNKEDMIGKTAVELGLWADQSERQEMCEQLSKEGAIRNWEYKIRTKSGEIGTVVSNVNMINIEGEECILVSSNNITKLKQYEREIARLDSLNLIGQMAGSIAHEVRNPMTAIKGFLQLFQQQDKYLEDRESIELMIEELDRVNDIISQFLSLAKKNTIELKLYSLNQKVKNLLPLIVADAVKNDVYVQTDLGKIPKIMLDKGEFRSLLVNLIHNGIQAMSSGGTLTIKTFADDNGVNLVIQDEGKGIPPEIIEKIGTPFLTTKENGTGLGLAVCYSIVERHNAKITIDTSLEGTSFKVTFPIAG